MNIRDRGLVKWQPFASMQQQFAGVKQLYLDELKLPQPHLDEAYLHDIDFIVNKAIYENQTLIVHVYEDGFIQKYEGKIKSIDYIQRKILVSGEIEKVIGVEEIVSVDVDVGKWYKANEA